MGESNNGLIGPCKPDEKRVRSKRRPTRERGGAPPPPQGKPHPAPRPGSTGNGIRTLLRPIPCHPRKQGGRVPHPGETERHATAAHAGGTPAFPGGASSRHSCFSRGHASACRAAARADAAEPCRLVALRCPLCHFVDHAFFRLFQESRGFREQASASWSVCTLRTPAPRSIWCLTHRYQSLSTLHASHFTLQTSRRVVKSQVNLL